MSSFEQKASRVANAIVGEVASSPFSHGDDFDMKTETKTHKKAFLWVTGGLTEAGGVTLCSTNELPNWRAGYRCLRHRPRSRSMHPRGCCRR